MQLSDFQICKRIGRGGYSEVYLCQKRDSKQVLALKRMTKDTLSEKNQTLVRCFRRRDNPLASFYEGFDEYLSINDTFVAVCVCVNR